jgi:uncharacterized damage-inducible protein DinB
MQFYGEWRVCNERLIAAIRPLSPTQLRFRPAPHLWPAWASAAHLAGTRVYWVCGVLREPGAETTPFIDPSTGEGWEDHQDTPRDAPDLVFALEASWRVVEGALSRWTAEQLTDEFRRESRGGTQIHTRRSVIMRMITHDAYHAGDISEILGMQGLPEIDLWNGFARIEGA